MSESVVILSVKLCKRFDGGQLSKPILSETFNILGSDVEKFAERIQGYDGEIHTLSSKMVEYSNELKVLKSRRREEAHLVMKDLLGFVKR